LNDLRESKDQYFSIFFELLTGCLISKTGLEINYETKIDGKTPDWVIQQNNIIQAIVEVKSFLEKSIWKNYEKFCDAVENELKTIPIGVFLEVNYLSDIYDYKDDFMPALNGFKEEVIEWLSNDERDDTFEFLSIQITVISFNSLLSNSEIGLYPTTVKWGYDKGVDKDIYKKIDKHIDIFDKNKYPFILVLVRVGHTANLEFSDVENIFKGKLISVVNFNKGIINQYLEKYSIVNKIDKYVNAVIYIDNQYSDKCKVNIINLNENAKYKLDYTIIAKIIQLDNLEFEINQL
jgi:hypothetical protein